MAEDDEVRLQSPAVDDEAILGYGDVATEDRVTEYEGLAAGGKARPTKARGSALVLVANGFPGYSSDADEIARLKAPGLWFPNTPDFLATATASTKSPLGASTAAEFIGALQAAKGPIARFTFIGHGSDTGLGLKGDTFGIIDEKFSSDDLATWSTEITALRSKFAGGATIDIVACNVAVGGAFVRELATSFGVCVRAFSEAIAWCVKFENDQIVQRGKIARLSAVEAQEPRDCDAKVWVSRVERLQFPKPICP